MVPAIDVARCLIRLASTPAGEGADYLVPMRLHKLLYYVQGWHLASRGVALFDGRIEAGAFGPVVPAVHAAFSGYRDRSIPPEEGAAADSLTGQDLVFIRSVWEGYKNDSATALAAKTQRDRPWLAARGGLPPGAPCDVEISHESLRAYFARRLPDSVARAAPHVDPRKWERAAADVAAGRVRTAQEVRRGVFGDRARSDG